MELWTEMRTAMVLARAGTVLAAAKELGIHRATVTRHIDALESHLGKRLFIRHRDGYSVTKDGESLASLAHATEDLLDGFVSQLGLERPSLSGSLRVTAIGAAHPYFLPAIQDFGVLNPDVSLHLKSTIDAPNLAQREADVAIQFGQKPEELDYVVLPSHEFSLGLCANKRYLEIHGSPESEEELGNYDLIALENSEGTLDLVKIFNVERNSIKLSSNEPATTLRSIKEGLGLGLATLREIEEDLDLIEVPTALTPLIVPVWIVTHVDLHRTRLVTSFVRHLRMYAQSHLTDVRGASSTTRTQLGTDVSEFP